LAQGLLDDVLGDSLPGLRGLLCRQRRSTRGQQECEIHHLIAARGVQHRLS